MSLGLTTKFAHVGNDNYIMTAVWTVTRIKNSWTIYTPISETLTCVRYCVA